VFDQARSDDYGWARQELAQLLSEAELAAAARNTLNAHYTDADLVQAIWTGVQQLGFAGGQVLEPGCGSGNFIAFAPPDAHMIGVELEPATAAIARALYPDAQISAVSFAEFPMREGSVDLAVGNVPFAKVALHDRRHNAAGHSIHNHFIIKSLHLTRPGGLVAVLTSRYTMDARNPAARREIAALADLVGVIRLPSGAHQQAAGTQAVTDLLILRRREQHRTADTTAWEHARPVDLPGGELAVNEYFLDRPQAVLGELTADGGLHGRVDLLVQPTGPTPPALATALEQVAAHASRSDLTLAPSLARLSQPAGGAARRPDFPDSYRPDLRDGYLQASDGSFRQISHGQAEPYLVPASQARELRHLIGLRDAVVALLDAEAASADDTADLDRLRAQLNQRYDAYAAAHGPLNRFTWRHTGRLDPDTGQERLARVRPPQGGFRRDPFAPAVYALEHFDPVTQQATKASIFRQRVIAPRSPRLGADTPADALAICLDTFGEVRLDQVARLLGTDESTARAELGTLVFDDPEAGRVVPAAEYLSGNVRAKLAVARAAAAEDPRYAPNVPALEGVVPKDLGPGEIAVRLGAAWIGEHYVQQFLRELLDDASLQVEHPGGSTWAVTGSTWGVLATSTWGTDRVPAPRLAQAILEQRVIRVFDELPEGKRVLNLTETVAAQQKATDLNERFAEWVWEDPQRASELASVYNERFNALVLRHYDDAELSLPGLAVGFQPHRHQVAAVARIIHEPAVLLAHEVGAGKTAEMAMGAMELRRLGFVTKPAIVVPNHLVEQFGREFLQLYPQARILVATKEELQQRDGRRTFVARCATGDWDAVVISRSAFERIPLRPEAQRDYLDQEVASIREWIQRSKAGRGLSVKRLERALLQAEERIKRKLDGAKDPGVCFEQTGIDYLFVDEAHGYKNLRTPSNIPNVAIDGSQRASDMDMKIDWLRHNRGGRWATYATATPISNSMAEAYVMQRYLRPDVLHAAGLDDFDSWAATFGEITTGIELSPEGTRFRLHSRFAKFRNIPELLRMWHLSADVKTAEDLRLPTPALVGGEVETVVVDPAAELLEFIAELGDRADDVRSRAVDPSVDNMLKISTDGRLAALDLRLVGRRTATPSKVDVAADHIAGLWATHRGDVYPSPDGAEDPQRGSLQLVFCDLGTPSDGWNVYDELREQLAARGVPRETVRFVHEARNDREKAELFAACRTGRVAVLIGSSERMGVGTNVQTRAVALHHLDCPWKPAEIHQRDGRILRQGNLNPEVRILRYVTQRSFDTFMWQTVERKARFIAQVMRGRLDVREIEDIGDVALSYSEVKALAAGDPRLLEKAQLDADLTRLERLERAWARNQETRRWDADRADSRVRELLEVCQQIQAAMARRVDTRGDAFAMEVDGARFAKRADAGGRLLMVMRRELDALGQVPYRRATVGRLGGFTVTTTTSRRADHTREVVLRLQDVPESAMQVLQRDLQETSPSGLVARLEHRLSALEGLHVDKQAEIERTRVEAGRARQTIGHPFPQREQLLQTRQRAELLAAELEELANEQAEHTAEQSAAPEQRPEANGQTPSATEHETGVPHDVGGEPVSDSIPNTHWAYFDDPDAAQRCAEELTTLDFLCGVDPSQALDDKWVLRAARDIPLGDGTREWQATVEAIVVRRGGIYDGDKSGWQSLHTGDHGPPPAPGRPVAPAQIQPATAAATIAPPSAVDPSPAPADLPAVPTATHQRPAAPPADPPPAVTPGTVAATPAVAGRIRITHTDSDTVVRDTDREDLAVRKVLNANRFSWSRNQQFWYLPRSWGYERRTSHVRGLLEGLRELDRPVHVEDGQPLPQRELNQARDHVRQLAEEAQMLANEQEQPAGAPASTPEQRPDDAARTPAAVDDATSVPDDADAATILRERLAPQGLPGGVVEQAGWPSRESEEISVEF